MPSSSRLPLPPSTLALLLALSLAPAGLAGCAIFKPVGDGDSGAAGTDGGSDDGTSDDGTSDGGTGDGGTGDGGSDSGASGDDGTGDDGGSDSGASGDSGLPDRLCELTIEANFPTRDCVTDTLVCGETRADTTFRGGADFGAEAYQNWYCGYASGDPWSGPERVYIFEHPGTGSVDFELNSPCADHDLAVVRWTPWTDDEECPVADTLISECEFDDSSGGGTVTVWSNEPIPYLVIVDTVDGETDNFEISVTCP